MFAQLKRESLRKLRMAEDKSPKGSIDAPIVDMIRAINAHPNYVRAAVSVTSSSCSGRIAVFCGEPAVAAAPGGAASGGSALITKGGRWLLAEHATITFALLQTALRSVGADAQSSSNMLIFKHEPFIMHVVCRDLDAAKELLQWGIACGFRESGVVLGNKKIMCAIRTTANALEIPLGRLPADQPLLVTEEYLQWVVDIANEKFRANQRKTDALFAAFRAKFGPTGEVDDGAAPTLTQVKLDALHELEAVDLKVVGHSSVRYGSSIIVFGGQGTTATGTTTRVADVTIFTASDDGSRLERSYHHVGAPSSTTPSARMYHSAVMVGARMIVFGGRAGPTRPLNDLFAFDLESKQWEQLTPEGDAAPCPRWKHSACVVGSTMYVHGGRTQDRVLGDLYALDLSQSPLRWRLIESPSPTPAFDHVGIVARRSQFVSVGGLSTLEGDEGTANQSMPLSFVVFDTTTETWRTEKTTGSSASTPPQPLVGANACAISDDLIVVVGGATSAPASDDSSSARSIQQIYALNTSSRQWSRLGDVTSASTHVGASFVGHSCEWMPSSSSLFVLGGGFQTFGFGQVHSPAFRCRLTLSAEPEPTQSVVTTSTTSSLLSVAGSASSSNHSGPPLGVVAEKRQVKAIKTLLESVSMYDKSRRVHVMSSPPSFDGDSSPSSTGFFLIPALPGIRGVVESSDKAELRALTVVADTDAYANKFGKHSGLNRNEVIASVISAFAQQHALPTALQRAIPERFEFIGDVLLVPRESFTEPQWGPFAQQMWAQVCASTTPAFSRVARKAFIDPGEKRQSHVELLYANPQLLAASPSARTRERPGWVEVRENGIVYGWDLTRVMFSSGNVTEKARMGRSSCQGDVVVDLFAGIGYYVVPFLVHGNAAFVHACEWNPDSVDALRFNLARNGVADRCRVYEGDNQVSAPTIGSVADRVNLGLLPTSEKAWPLAVQVLKPSGGWLHVHDNVSVEQREQWEQHVVDSISALATALGRRWRVSCPHVERVKSYAPKVWHLVADVRCEEVGDGEDGGAEEK